MSSTAATLWGSGDPRLWLAVHAQHARAVAAKHARVKGSQLATLQLWYEQQLPTAVHSRSKPHITQEELVKLVRKHNGRSCVSCFVCGICSLCTRARFKLTCGLRMRR
jgi:hypothetical protein